MPDSFPGRWRAIAAAAVTLLIVFIALADTLGRLFVDPDFHVSEIIFGTLVTFWASLLVLEGLTRMRNP